MQKVTYSTACGVQQIWRSGQHCEGAVRHSEDVIHHLAETPCAQHPSSYLSTENFTVIFTVSAFLDVK